MLIQYKDRRVRFIFRLISLVVIFQLLLNDISFALSPSPGTQNPAVRREAELLDYIVRGRLKFAETAEDERFLKELNGADALLLSHGKILAARELKSDPLRLIRRIVHEEVEAVLRIMAREDRSKYSALINMVLSRTDVREAYERLVPAGQRPDLPDDLLANDMLANAFELLVLKLNRLVEEREISPADSEFIKAIEPLINANKHNYFTGVFWDPNVREAKIRVAMANGLKFYQVASRRKAGEEDRKSRIENREEDTAGIREVVRRNAAILEGVDLLKKTGIPVYYEQRRAMAELAGLPVDILMSDLASLDRESDGYRLTIRALSFNRSL
jgi:hypothetical protein